MEVYCSTNLITGNKYIGISRIPKKEYYGSGKLIKEALLKYGKENFIKVILASTDNIKKLADLERYYIEYFGAAESDLFYNIAKGGIGPSGVGHKVSEEARKQISIFSKKMWQDDKMREKILESRKKSESTRRKNISNSKKGSKLSNSHKQKIKIASIKRADENRENIKALWKDPAYRKNRSKHYVFKDKKAWQKRLSEAGKKAWANKEKRERIINGQRK